MEVFDFVANISYVQGTLLAIGLGLVIFEMFHPGFGAPGITGAILLLVGIILTAQSITEALIMIMVILAILAAVLILVLRSATNGHLSRKLVLSEAQKKEHGYIGTEDLEFFVGKEGTVTGILRPSGIADFDGIKLDVVSEGEFIQKGVRVKIVEVEGRRIVVREVA